MSNGGTLSTGLTLSLADEGSTSQTSLSVTGANSSVSATGNLYVGYAGQAFATVASGGSIATDATFSIATTAGSTGTFNLNEGGTLQVGGTGGIAIGDGTGVFNFGGGTIEVINSNLTTSVPMTLADSTTSTVDTNGFDATLSGILSGAGAIAKSGDGNLTLSAANTHTGGTILHSGTLTMGNVDSLGSPAASVTLNGGTLDLGGFSPIMDSVIFNGGTITNGSLANTSAYEVQTGTLDLDLSGSVALTKSGPGTFTLTGTNTYTGGTTINGGTLQLGVGGATGSLTGNVTNNGTLAFNRSGEHTFSGVISGTGGMVNDGWILRLSAAQTYTGPTIINSGFLVLPSVDQGLSDQTTVNIAGGGTLDISNRSQTISGLTGSGSLYSFGGNMGSLTLDIASEQSYTFSGDLNWTHGTFTLTKTGVGTQILSGNNTHFGTTTIQDGILQIGDGGTSGSINSSSVVNNAELIFDRSNAHTFSGAISGAGNVTKTGDGTLTLEGDNSYTGTTTIAEGTVQLGSGGSTGSITSSSIVNNANLVINRSNNYTLSGAVSGTGTIAKSGAGALTLTGANTYSGGTILHSGTLTLGNVDSLGATSASLTLNGGTLDLGGFSPTTGKVIFNGGTFTNGSLANTSAYEVQTGTLDLDLSGSVALTKTGPGNFTLTGANTYTGGTTINGGILQIASDANLGTAPGSPTPGHLTLDGGTLLTTNTFNLSPHRSIALGASGGTLETTDATDLTYDGIIAGGGGLTKSGTGNLTLTGANTYTGGTTVSAGTLTGNTNSIQGNVINNAAVIFDQTSTGIYAAHISGTGTLTKSGTGNLTLTGANTHAGGTTISSGTLQLGDGGDTGSVTGNISNHGTLVFNRSDDHTFSGVISGAGGMVNDGWILRLSAAQTYTGPTIINSGLLILPSVDQGLSAATTVHIEGGGMLDISNRSQTMAGLTGSGTLHSFGGNSGSLTLDIASEQSYAFSGNLTSIYGTFPLTKTGAGTQILSGTNTHAGTTTIQEGTLQIGDGGTSGSINSSSLVNNAELIFDRSNAYTFSGAISGAGNVTKTGDGTLTLEGNNSFTGTTTIAEGTLQLGSGGSTGSIASGSIVNNSNLVINRSNNYTLSGVVSGTGTIAKSGAGALTLTGANTYSGGTTVAGGLIEFSALNDFGTGDITLNGGGLRWADGVTTDVMPQLGSIGASGGRFDTNGNNVTFSSALTTANSLIKQGTGALTLSGANTAGNFALNGGTLDLASGASLTTSSWISLADVGGSSGQLSLTDATLNIGSDLYVGYAGDGSLTIGTGGLVNATRLRLADLAAGDATVTLNPGGTLQVGGANGILAGSGTTALNFAGGTLRLNASDFTSHVPITLTGTTTFDTNGHNGGIYGSLSGTGGFTKVGAGVLTVTHANPFSGAVSVEAGTLVVNTATDLGTGNGNVTIHANAALAAATHLEFARNVAVSGSNSIIASSNHLEVGSAGDGSLTIADGGILASNTTTTLAYFSGDTGTVDVTGTDSTLYAQTSLRVGFQGTGTLTLADGGEANAQNLVLASHSGSTGTININTGGLLQVGGANGITVGDGTGTFNLAGGTLRVGGDARVVGPPPSDEIDLNDLANGTRTVIAANVPQPGDTGLSAAIPMALSNTSTIDTNGSAAILSGVLSGTGSLIKTGDGTLFLSAESTYTGTTTIQNGTLTLTGSPQATSAIEVASGATLSLDIELPTAAANAAVTLGGTVLVTGTPVDSSYTLLTANSITGTPVLAVAVPGYQLQVIGDNELQLVQTVDTPYEIWADGEPYDGDANGDGISNIIAFLLGAADPDANALALLPAVNESGGSLMMTFSVRNADARGDAALHLQHSSDLGIDDPWTSVAVPETSGTTSGVTFTILPGSPLNSVTATIAPSESINGKLFSRLEGAAP